MTSDRDSFGYTSFHAGLNARARCSVYANGTLPNLSMDGCGLGVTVYLAGDRIDADHVRFARDLLHQAERFAAEAKRLYAEAQTAQDGGKDSTASAA